jgi:hypothetical protein
VLKQLLTNSLLRLIASSQNIAGYIETRKTRELSNYELAFMAQEKLAQNRLEQAKRFVARIERYLREEGWLKN